MFKRWQITTVGEVCDILSGYGFPKHLQGNTEGDYPFYKVSDISQAWVSGSINLTTANNYLSKDETKALKAKLLPAGTTVLAKIGEAIKLNRRAMLTRPSLVDNNVIGICPKAGKADPKYIFYFFLTVKLGDYSQATTVPSVRKPDISGIPLPLASLEDQKQIVAEIEKQFSRLDEAVASLKRIQANLKRYKAAVLKAAVEGKLTEQWRKDHPDVEPAEQLLKRILAERHAKWEAEELAKMVAKGIKPKDDSWKKKYKEPAGPDTANLPELPDGWVWARAEQLCGFITKGTTPAANKLFAGEGDIPFIKVYNLTHHGLLDFSINPTFVADDTHRNELARSKVLPGDVLMNIVGPPLGKVSLVPDNYQEWNINQAVAIYRSVPGYNRKFLCHCLLTESVLSWATKRSKATAGQFNLTLELCRDLPLPLPPLKEQAGIVEEIDRRLSVTEELEATIEINLIRAERLRQTILMNAFKLSSNI